MEEKISCQLVSIIILSYKNLNYIFDTINSVLIQDYPNIELIISDDNTEEFNKDIYIDYIVKNNKGNIKKIVVNKNKKNLGLVKNLNNAIKMSKGSIIKSIAADDTFYNDVVITSFVKFIEINHSSVVASKIARCDENLKTLDDRQFNKVFNEVYKPILTNFNQQKWFIQLCKGSFIPAPGVFFTKKTFDKYGYFDEAYRLIEDWPMWLRLVRDGCKIDYLDEISVKYRTNVGISMTPNETFRKENILCIKNEILPYIKDLGYWFNKKTKWRYIRGCEYIEYSALNKSKFLIENLDLILIYLIPNRVINILKDLLTKI